MQPPADTDASPDSRKATRQEPGTTDTTAGSDSPKRAATARRDPNSGFPPRTSRNNPELRVHLPVAVLSRRPRHSTSRTGSSVPPATPAVTGNTSPALAPLLHTHPVQCAHMPGARGDGRTAPADGGDDAALVDFHYFGIGAPPHDAVEIGGVRRGHGGVQYHGVSESQQVSPTRTRDPT